MANKKRRKRPRPTGVPKPSGGARQPGGGANEGRRERKDMAREARDRARKHVARRDRIRRAVTLLIAGGIGLVVVGFITRGTPPSQLAEGVQAAVTAAGCDGPAEVLPDAPGSQHLAVGESTTYAERPATSGFHAASPLPPDPNVYDAPVDETQAVHFMEHAGVLLYYRQGVVPQDVVDRLATVADDERNTILAPFPELLEGQDLAFATWNRLLTGPAGTTADQAEQIARGFIEAYVCTSAAPEPGASPEC